jgi:hypothetical protein
MRVAARRAAKRSKAALARRLAVILHRMWVDGIDFQAQPHNPHDAGYACAFPLREEPGGGDGRGPAAGHFGATRTPFLRWAPSANADRIR